MPQYSTDFLKSVDFSLREEVGPFPNGGYLSPEKAARLGDPGGETKWGISKRSYPDLDIAALTREQAIEIYFRDYWQSAGVTVMPKLNQLLLDINQRARCDALPWPLNFAHFDCAVNVGNRKTAQDGTPVWHGRANAILQRACGVEDDGYIGPATLAAIAARQPRDLAIKAILEREHYYRTRDSWADGFKSGWLKRTKKLLATIALPEAT